MNITTAGEAGNNAPYVRFFSGSTGLSDVYRYNDKRPTLAAGDQSQRNVHLYEAEVLKHPPLGTWHRIQMDVTAKGSSSAVRVGFDGVLEYSSTVTLGATSLSIERRTAEGKSPGVVRRRLKLAARGEMPGSHVSLVRQAVAHVGFPV